MTGMKTGKPDRYAIVGAKHRGTEAMLASLPPDEPLTLVREPDNRFDPNAVQVWARGAHIGYVPKTQNAALSQFIDHYGKPWTAPRPVSPNSLASDAAPVGVEVFKAIDARLHLGSNTFPLAEVI